MNYKEALSVKELAASDYEVLKKLDVECGYCDERGQVLFLNALTPSRCLHCNGKRKVKWKWQPKRFELYFDRRTNLIYSFLQKDKTSSRHLWGTCGWTPEKLLEEECIPILPWETIEKILEKAGIGFDWFYPADGAEIEMWWKEDNPNQDPCVIIKLIENESRQEVVMRAVEALKRELI